MKMARVIGTVVSTIKHEAFRGVTLLMVQPVAADGTVSGESFVAADAAQAGIGDYVLVVQEGKSARLVMENKSVPCEAVVVGVIDYLQIGGQQVVLRPPKKASDERRV